MPAAALRLALWEAAAVAPAIVTLWLAVGERAKAERLHRASELLPVHLAVAVRIPLAQQVDDARRRACERRRGGERAYVDGARDSARIGIGGAR